MQIIKLDATIWKTVIDFYDALLAAIGTPKWHGDSTDALIDSMIWGGINAIEPSYTIRIFGAEKLPKNVREHVELVKQALAKARLEYQSRKGGDVEVSMEIQN